jgi:hypothetical protein
MRITIRTPIAPAGASRATRSVTRTRRYALAALAALAALGALASLVVGGGLAAAPPAAANAAHVPVLRISPEHADFGSLFLGFTSQPAVFTVRNRGGATSGILSVGIEDLTKPPNNFGVVQDTCTGTALPSLHSCSVSVVFHPQAGGLDIGELFVNPPHNCCPPGPSAVLGGKGVTFSEGGPPSS